MSFLSKKIFLQISASALALCVAFLASGTVYAELHLNLKSNANRNTYVNGQEILIEVEHAAIAADGISYHWQNYRGEALTQAKMLTAAAKTVIKPPAGPLPRYLGLVFTPAGPDISISGQQPGEAKEYGFAVFPELPPDSLQANRSSWMGMVHADLDDPWLQGWVKTMTWKTTPAKWWRHEMQRRRDAGFIELPIVSGYEWDSDDRQPVAADQLARLGQRIGDYFSADQETLAWETGIEENLKVRFSEPYYFANLTAKSDVVRAVVEQVNPDIKLIFQIANMRFQDVGIFMQSKAARNYDILALHPYKWPDFPAPEIWLTEFLDNVNKQMQKSGRVLPVWITETGAPHRGNYPGLFFGYPKKNKAVGGLGRQEMIAYMIKFHVLSYHHGVEKVFWYNYQDRGPQRDYAEDHFGLIDYWGYPKPAYSAYVYMSHSLAGKAAAKVVQNGDIRAYRFSGEDEDVLVAWSYPAVGKTIALAELGISAADRRHISVSNAIGDPLPIRDNQIELSGEPVFIHIRQVVNN